MDVWGEETVKEFYAVYPQIRHNYYDGPEAFYQQNGFGDLSRFRAKFLENIKNAYDAGVLIAGGSDCVYPSLWDGEVMHRELELFVKAGISEVQAIKCCTYNGAKILRRDKEFGSLQKGMSADLLDRRRQSREEHLRHAQRQTRLPARQTSRSRLAEVEMSIVFDALGWLARSCCCSRTSSSPRNASKGVPLPTNCSTSLAASCC